MSERTERRRLGGEVHGRKRGFFFLQRSLSLSLSAFPSQSFALILTQSPVEEATDGVIAQLILVINLYHMVMSHGSIQA